MFEEPYIVLLGLILAAYFVILAVLVGVDVKAERKR